MPETQLKEREKKNTHLNNEYQNKMSIYNEYIKKLDEEKQLFIKCLNVCRCGAISYD